MLIAVVFWGFVLVLVMGVAGVVVDSIRFRGHHPQPTEPLTPVTDTGVRFAYLRSECFDGASSSAIGRRGACSHHGGVVDVYQGADGTVLRCGGDTDPPSGAERQAEQMRLYGRLFCSSTW